VPEWFSSALKSTRISISSGAVTPTAAAGSVDTKLKAGLYGVVRSLLRVLEKGVIGKLILDTVLDACSAMQVNLAAVVLERLCYSRWGCGLGGGGAGDVSAGEGVLRWYSVHRAGCLLIDAGGLL
jgi:hypothetical protein